MSSQIIENYIIRLKCCGYSQTEAYCICQSFIKEFNLKALDAYIVALELDTFKEGSYAIQ